MKTVRNILKEKIALLRLRQGDTEAFGFIYDLYIDKIYRYAAFRVSDQQVAQDITQETFLAAWEYIVSKKPVDNLQSLIYRIAYHKIVDHYRIKERQASLIDDQALESEPFSEHPTTDIELHFVRQQLKNIKQEYQDIITLRYLEDMSITDIAAILEKETNTVRVTLHRALQAIKDLQNKDKK